MGFLDLNGNFGDKDTIASGMNHVTWMPSCSNEPIRQQAHWQQTWNILAWPTVVTRNANLLGRWLGL